MADLDRTPAKRFWESDRFFLASLLVVALIAIVTNLDKRPIELLFTAVGLASVGPPAAELLQHLTEGLVVLFVLALYVERRPFKRVERKLTTLEQQHLHFLAGQLKLQELLAERVGEPVGNLSDLVLPAMSPVLSANISIDLVSPGNGPNRQR